MPTPLRRRLRLARRFAFYAAAIGLVCVALAVGALSQALPFVERHPQRIQAWLSERAGRPIRFDRVETAWTRRGPLLRLDGLRVGAGDGVRIGQAEVLLSMYAGVLPGRSFTQLRLRGLALTLLRGADGSWSVQGLPTAAQGGDPLDALQGLGELQVIDGRLAVHAPELGVDARLPKIDLRLRVDGDRLRVGAQGWIDPQQAPLTAVLDMDRRRGSGQAYVAARPAELAGWAGLLQAGGIRVDGGAGQVQGWAQLQRHRIVAVSVEATLRELRLSGAALAAGGARPQTAFTTLRATARWRQIDGGWRLDAPRLQIGQAGQPTQRLDGLTVAGGRRVALLGERLDAAPLLALAALSDGLPPGLRAWLHAARPRLQLTQLALTGRAGGPLYGQGRLTELAFAPVGQSPGVSGLRGRFDGDAQGGELVLDAASPVRFDWPSGFGVPHDVQLAGRIVVFRDGDDLRVATPALRVQGSDYGADVRGGLRFQADGSRPWIDLAAQLQDAPVVVAKKFWVHSKMSKAATDWLDAALQGGRLRDGHALVSGDLDQWPFVDRNGRFEASARLDDVKVRFQREWPAVEKVDADVAFIGNGFEVHGRGEMGGVPVERLSATLPDYKQGQLSVLASSRAETGQLLAMLRQSPLHKRYGDTLDALSASGPADVSFDLLQPLRRDVGGHHLRGKVELRGARIADRRWEVAFDDMRGSADYRDTGFEAPQLAVLRDGHPGELALRAGDGVSDPQQAFEAALSASVDADELLERAPEMAWLKPYVQGRSRWNIGVALPKTADGGAQPPTRLQLHSDLVGTELLLPAPMDKGVAAPLATSVTVPLPVGTGRIEVAFGKLMALVARSQNGKTGVKVVMGSDHVAEDPPGSGLVVSGRTAALNAIDWIGLVSRPDPNTSATPGAEDPMPLRQIDVLADHLLLLGGVFDNTRLRLQPQADTVAVHLDGPALAGELSVPSKDGGVLGGRLARVHWRAAPAPAAAGAASAANAAADPTLAAAAAAVRPLAEALDPASIPALALDVDDLRFGTMNLGAASLRTRKLADGMQVDQLHLRSDKQKIDISGDWRGKGAAARTQLSASVDSQDLGELMQNLDFGGQLRGGEGTLTLRAAWPGDPAGFQLATLQGQLDVAARNGQLLELNPGAGRVLGLFSVAQLPRRLMFDFRDFFSKGFAFNRIDGQVRFGDGVARSEAMLIDGPAAEIKVRGQADLRAQQFDQTIDVNPKSGNLLTVVGAVAGGPVGAAVGAAANAVLGKPLGAIGARTYRVTGPWKDPKVEVIERESSRTPAPPTPSSPP
ncbi:TIGR02099 family protein [Xanthomonas hyacinthi]|uniref:TIGR02099 family protein n=1 Tax=Xanthomonas hyacinthi TaxID=56455 RepID=A0A2S7ETG1_9XANT|nr:YhdP family protein [Xanthomonas hyacinthi]PPU96430.1 TIGR02099 family protein [Xanthomonas hyacinthi]QGY78912.1 TIGR02099 family protein [Xanthomonas hyacinthi]